MPRCGPGCRGPPPRREWLLHHNGRPPLRGAEARARPPCGTEASTIMGIIDGKEPTPEQTDVRPRVIVKVGAADRRPPGDAARKGREARPAEPIADPFDHVRRLARRTRRRARTRRADRAAGARRGRGRSRSSWALRALRRDRVGGCRVGRRPGEGTERARRHRVGLRRGRADPAARRPCRRSAQREPGLPRRGARGHRRPLGVGPCRRVGHRVRRPRAGLDAEPRGPRRRRASRSSRA